MVASSLGTILEEALPAIPDLNPTCQLNISFLAIVTDRSSNRY